MNYRETLTKDSPILLSRQIVETELTPYSLRKLYDIRVNTVEDLSLCTINEIRKLGVRAAEEVLAEAARLGLVLKDVPPSGKLNAMQQLKAENANLRKLIVNSSLTCVHCGKKQMSADSASTGNPSDDAQELTADGYPTEGLLDRIRNWSYEDGGFERLLQYLPSVWFYGSEYFKAPRFPYGVYVVVTGGWSGNEDIIMALKQNTLFWSMCWESSFVGGRYGFRVPAAFRKGAT